MQILVVGEPIRELMDQPWIAVEVENDRLAGGEQAVEVAHAEPMRMLCVRLHLVQVHDIYEPNFQLRQPLAQDCRRRQRLQRRHVATRGHDHIRLGSLVVAGLGPDTDPLGAMRDRLIDGQELHVPLLVSNDNVDVVG